MEKPEFKPLTPAATIDIIEELEGLIDNFTPTFQALANRRTPDVHKEYLRGIDGYQGPNSGNYLLAKHLRAMLIAARADNATALEPAVSSADPLDDQAGGDHYRERAIQPIEYIEANGLGFLEGCIVKRATRHQDKNGVEDLQKIIHEARLIAKLRYQVEI